MSDRITAQQIYDLVDRKTGELHKAIRTTNKELKGELDTFKETTETRFDGLGEKLDKKYASKWVQNLMVGMIALILTAFLTGVLEVVWPGSNPNATAEVRNVRPN